MKKKKNKMFVPGKMGTVERVQLALAFVGEHKELFKEWIESKGGKVEDDE